jgi:uncharacterized damage-inducible protein DinB
METFSAPDDRSVPFHGDERAQLESWLTFYRETLLIKCDGLDAAQMKLRPVATSQLSLLGLIRHMTCVEQAWFEHIFMGTTSPEYYKTPTDRDGDFRDLDEIGLDQVLANFRRVIASAHECARGRPLDEMAATLRHQHQVDLRWIYVHMIEEYARHCGHADILRELIDGVTGE